MIGLVIFLASITLYGWLGIRLVARPHIVREVEKEAERCKRYPSLYSDPDELAAQLADKRRFAAVDGLLLAVVWPIVLVFRLAVGRLIQSAPLAEAEARAQLARRDQRIAQLERELGVRQ